MVNISQNYFDFHIFLFYNIIPCIAHNYLPCTYLPVSKLSHSIHIRKSLFYFGCCLSYENVSFSSFSRYDLCAIWYLMLFVRFAEQFYACTHFFVSFFFVDNFYNSYITLTSTWLVLIDFTKSFIKLDFWRKFHFAKCQQNTKKRNTGFSVGSK